MTAIWYLWFRKTLPTCDMSLKTGPEEPCVRTNPQVRHTPQDTASPRRARHFPIHLTFVLSFELSGKVCKCFEENFRCKKKIGFYWIQDSSGICWHCIRVKISLSGKWKNGVTIWKLVRIDFVEIIFFTNFFMFFSFHLNLLNRENEVPNMTIELIFFTN